MTECIARLTAIGISYNDATELRRISMTLHRWHELECGDSNDWQSSSLVRGRKESGVFTHEDNGAPYMEVHSNRVKAPTAYYSIPDRERGALKRLAAIMARYPGFISYVQGDPRGAALYILRPDDLPADFDINLTRCEWLSANYSRGVAVYK